MHDTLTIAVESVRGRYPHARTVLKPENVDAFAIWSGEEEILVRIEDKSAPDAWLEVRITVRGKT